jgi:hypothetical protein
MGPRPAESDEEGLPCLPGHHRFRLMVLAGSCTMMAALRLATGDWSAVALAFAISGPVLVLGFLFVFGARRARGTPTSGGCPPRPQCC